MLDLKIKDIIDLVDTEIKDPEFQIQKIFDWHFEKEKLIAQISVGASASLFIALFISFINNTNSLGIVCIIILMVFALCPGLFGIYRLKKLNEYHRQYLTALILFHEFEKIRPFVKLYRETLLEEC